MESNFRNSLAPPDPRWKGLGALERPPDVRDYHMEFLPKVMATAPPPSLVTMSPEQWPLVYDQNGYGACVDNSECGTMTAENYTESSKTEIVVFDALEAYFANGGLPDGSNGIPTSLSLERMRSIGALDKKTGRRRKIDNYAFAPRQSDAFREAIASALASGSFVVLATLLPSGFGRHSTGSMTSGYHQIVIANYDGLRDDDEFNGPNSWGLGFGERGFYGMTWRHIIQQDFQNGYTYAYVMTDAKDYEPPDPPPPPPPDPVAIPEITNVKQKGSRKTRVIGVFDPGATLSVNGRLSEVGVDEDRFTLRKLNVGRYEFVVTNPNGKSSPPWVYNVV